MITSGSFQKIYDPSVGESERWYINDHCFIQDQAGLWHMFGITQTEPAKPLQEVFFAHATSESLLCPQWEKQAPVLHAQYERWKETHVWAPHIIENGGVYFMYYCAGGRDHSRYKIHLATSRDLWSWERHADNPMVVDGFEARDPMVIRHEDTWIMYYTATSTPAGGHHVVAAVDSTDLIHWQNKRVAFEHPTLGTGAGPTESPFVVERNKKFYLFVCINDPYNDSAVYEADTPHRWRLEDQVGRFPSHASEVIRLADRSEDYISRAGWGEGGLYVAELHWA